MLLSSWNTFFLFHMLAKANESSYSLIGKCRLTVNDLGKVINEEATQIKIDTLLYK